METLTGSSFQINDSLRYLDSLIVQCTSSVPEESTADQDDNIIYFRDKPFNHDNDAFWISESSESSDSEILTDDILNESSDGNLEHNVNIFTETEHIPSKAHLEPLARVNAYKWKKLNLMTGKNICPWPERSITDENASETKLQPETPSITVLNSSFQHLEALLLECEGDLDTLHQRAGGVTSSDPKASSPVELNTLHAYWLELYTQVSFDVSHKIALLLQKKKKWNKYVREILHGHTSKACYFLPI